MPGGHHFPGVVRSHQNGQASGCRREKNHVRQGEYVIWGRLRAFFETRQRKRGFRENAKGGEEPRPYRTTGGKMKRLHWYFSWWITIKWETPKVGEIYIFCWNGVYIGIEKCKKEHLLSTLENNIKGVLGGKSGKQVVLWRKTKCLNSELY